ncbi:endonuclease/exonuclease/phosphatase family protein [Dactylosporangium vinaceum]|uniref:Endonuclease/exonuclease/phosphatase family protein n=1 Tax=Dactylosporangium vinaceum TaxID=53362 RepID=A0ABV5MFR1_9ACTN|nr:endonuclease/exonuclease/phosphatase family protein [Dactylosporangium vinaceum]UAB98818.1 endonuclease/exonuclease/phosphatase family protein [Dactylosporangium vinaceum]
MSLTLLTYNIKNGGGDRLAAIARVITGERPDVVALQELRGTPQLGALTGMRQFVAGSWRGQPVGLLVARHLRVLAAGRVARPFFHAAAWVRIASPIGAITVISAHLCPYWGRLRQAEAGWLASFLRKGVLLGDLNTLDPWGEHAGELATLPEQYRRRHLNGREPDIRATALLARRGLVDVFRQCGTGPAPTVPTTQGGGHEFARLRLDYLWATRDVAARFTDCRVVTGGEAESGSDHYPLVGRAA